MDRIKEHWQALTDRERVLVSTALVLAVLVLGYFMLVRPIAAYQASSEAALKRAKATYSVIAAGAAELTAAKSATTSKQEGEAAPLRVTVSRTARASGVAISRLQPGDNGALTVWVESMPSQALYSWLDSLAREAGIAPDKVIVQKSTAEGRLRVQLQFRGAV